MLRGLPPTAEFDERELAVLRLACSQRDLVQAIERELRGQALTVEGHRGQPRGNPLVGLLISARTAELRFLAELELSADVAQVPAVRSVRSRRAANARWRQKRETDAVRRELRGVS